MSAPCPTSTTPAFAGRLAGRAASLYRRLLALARRQLPFDFGLLAKRRRVLAFGGVLRPLRALGNAMRGTIQFVYVCDTLTFICDPFALVGQCFALICYPFALVRQGFTAISDTGSQRYITRQAFHSFGQLLSPSGQPLALACEMFTLSRNALALFGDPFALNCDALTFPCGTYNGLIHGAQPPLRSGSEI